MPLLQRRHVGTQPLNYVHRMPVLINLPLHRHPLRRPHDLLFSRRPVGEFLHLNAQHRELRLCSFELSFRVLRHLLKRGALLLGRFRIGAQLVHLGVGDSRNIRADRPVARRATSRVDRGGDGRSRHRARPIPFEVQHLILALLQVSRHLLQLTLTSRKPRGGVVALACDGDGAIAREIELRCEPALLAFKHGQLLRKRARRLIAWGCRHGQQDARRRLGKSDRRLTPAAEH
mmetsp:Transcript_10921/g.36204  ORF Transcript_10921/g.36204 Transcript_10921/m.36204 type:complete len:232 (+) Transcript_10921:1389-2084(+)